MQMEVVNVLREGYHTSNCYFKRLWVSLTESGYVLTCNGLTNDGSYCFLVVCRCVQRSNFPRLTSSKLSLHGSADGVKRLD